jgi:DNA-binding Lrp family transcriptional regulator
MKLQKFVFFELLFGSFGRIFIMKITTRQKEFLQSLIDLHKQKASPVHYSEVAKKLGVSKWTAYDMLQLLHKEGLLEVEYLIPESDNYKWEKLGRSIITFFPTKKGYAISNLLERKLSTKAAELNKLKNDIIQKFEKIKGKFNLKDLFQEALQTKSPFIFCACVLLILILLVKKITEGIAEIQLLTQVVPLNATNNTYIELALTVFVGMCLTTLAKHINKIPKYITGSNNDLNEYMGYIQTYNQYVSQMDKDEQKSLLAFLRETLEEINDKKQK